VDDPALPVVLILGMIQDMPASSHQPKQIIRIIKQLIAADTDQIVHAAVLGTERTLLYFLGFFLTHFLFFLHAHQFA
jgi:uncharacterized membrane protein